jgi:glycosyltransferase involved in cell wall biosynthesis
MGSDCRDSLEQDYRIRREQCFVTLAPQDTDWWTPDFRRTEPGSRLRLLFVTNDFERKGGDFLLELYSRHLADTCTLTIASNDPVLESRTLPTGVEWLRGRGREQLLEIYRSSDLFVFPTKQDFMPQVIAEALATGTPCIANDVGGTRDLVQDGSNGYLMSPDATHQEWNQRIQRLFQNRAELERMSREARRFAEEKLSLERFQDTLRRVTSGLFASRPNL